MKRRHFLKTTLVGLGAVLYTTKVQAIAPSPGRLCRFAVGGDYHFGASKASGGHHSPAERMQAYATMINKQDADFSMHVGDLTMYSDFELFNQWTETLDAPAIWVVGNHDKHKSRWHNSWQNWTSPPSNAQDVAFHETCYWWEESGWVWIVFDNSHLPDGTIRTREGMIVSNKIVNRRVDWLEDILDTIAVPPEKRLLFAHCPLDKHPLIRTGQANKAIRRMGSVMAGKVRYGYFGHQHINSYHHDLGTTPYYTAGFTTAHISPQIMQKRPANDKRAFLIVDIFDDGKIKHTWVTL